MANMGLVHKAALGVMAALSSCFGFSVGVLAQGVPDSRVTDATTQSGPVTANFGGLGAGIIRASSGRTWVEGSGLLSNPQEDICNDWLKGWSDTRYEGTIVNAEGKWTIHASAEVKLEPKAIYTATSPVMLEDYRTDCHAVLEIRGDFWAVVGNKQSVDSYTRPGRYFYDITGGGAVPAQYPGIGVDQVVTGPGPWSGVVSNGGSCSQSYRGEFVGNVVAFNLYLAGTQYMYNKKEEDVSLYTKLDHPVDADGNIRKGWHGTLTSWTFQGGAWKLLKNHDL